MIRLLLLAALLLIAPQAKAVDVRSYNLIENDGKDDTKALISLLTTSNKLKNPNVLKFREGQYDFEWRETVHYRKELARFSLVGAAPVTTWQHGHQGGDRSYTRLVFKNVPPEKWILDLATPSGQRAGAQQFINLEIVRDTPGNGFRFRGDGEPTSWSEAARGLLIRDCSISVRGQGPHWTREFQGRELPEIQGTALELVDQYDARIEGVSVWGFENQLVGKDNDRLRVTGWHGGNSARSIVLVSGQDHAPAVIDAPIIENVIVSGIDVTAASVRDATVEVGYQGVGSNEKVGPRALPSTAKWTVDKGSKRVDVTGIDPRRWIPRWSVVRLKDKPLYVQSVDDRGFTFLGHDVHCELPKMEGDGSELVRLLGVPYIFRGDQVDVYGYIPNFNMPINGLPVYAAFPNKTPVKLRGRSLQQSFWSSDPQAKNEAIVGGWSERQWAYGGCVLDDDAWLRPDHPWVYPFPGPKFDANKREAPR